jgi:predicted ester cyclase
MTSPQKRLVRLFYEEMWNRADTSLIPEIFHPGFTFRGSLGPVLVGHDEFAGYVRQVTGALGDYRCDILEMTEEEDRVVARVRFSGLHRGPFMGHAPTGKPVEWAGSAHFTFAGGKVKDLWVLGDVHGLLQLLESQVERGQ